MTLATRDARRETRDARRETREGGAEEGRREEDVRKA